MATLSEWASKIEAVINEAIEAGFEVDATTCCCGEGLKITDPQSSEKEWIL